jgi:glycosyltransferase involved in cell wall biosynthesis
MSTTVDNLPLISVIIPCRNEEKYIGQCLESLIDMDYPNELLEIIIVDGNSTDNSRTLIQKYQKVYTFIQLIQNSKLFTPYALNIGIKSAKGIFVMIASAHATFSKNYINNIVEAIVNLKADGAGGTIITDVKNKTKKTLSISKVLSNKFGVGNSMFRIGVQKPIQVDTVPFGIYKKDLLVNIGSYNENLIRNHDIELSKRLIATNKKIYLVPSSQCTYYARETFFSIAKNNFKNGLWNILTVYLTKRFSSLSIRHFVPLLFLLSLIIPSILMFWYPLLGLITTVSFILYTLTMSITSFKVSDKTTTFYFILWTFFVLHFSYGLGSLIGLFRIDFLLKK